jgi:hypothetical protein
MDREQSTWLMRLNIGFWLDVEAGHVAIYPLYRRTKNFTLWQSNSESLREIHKDVTIFMQHPKVAWLCPESLRGGFQLINDPTNERFGASI